MVDRHVVKMILESAQLLSTAHRVIDGVEQAGVSPSGRSKKEWKLSDVRDDLLYSSTHINHPSAIWARESRENYSWLYRHFMALGSEYTHRYGKQHLSCIKFETILQSPPNNLQATDMTPMPSCMADEFKVGNDPITNYRNYYIMGKSSLHRWTNRLPPQWIPGEVIIIPTDDEDDNNNRTVYTIKR